MRMRFLRRFGLSFLGLALALAAPARPARADSWTQAVRSGDVVLLPISAGAYRIERYDLAARTWLAPIPLAAKPRDVAAAPGAIYVLEPGTLRRLTASGSPVWAVPVIAEEIEVDPAGRVFSLQTRVLNAFDAATGAHLAYRDLGTGFMYGLSVAPGLRRLYVQRGYGPDVRIGSIPYDAAGGFGEIALSERIATSLSVALRTWVFPDEDLVTDGHGQLYDAETLAWRDSLLGEVDDLAFAGALPVRLQHTQLTRYAAGFEPIGTSFHPSGFFAPDALFVDDGDALLFTKTSVAPPGAVATVEAIPLDAIVFPPPPPPPDPTLSDFIPAPIGVDAEGTLFLLATDFLQQRASVHRWSVPGGAFVLPHVSLRREPSRYTDCPALGGLLFAYERGELRVLPYDGTAETHWRNLRAEPTRLACASGHVIVATPVDGGGGSLDIWAPDGAHVDSIAIGEPFGYSAWSETHRRFFLWERVDFPTLRLASYAVDAGGAVEAAGETLLHSDFNGQIVGTDGPYFLAGPNAYDPETLAVQGSLGRAYAATWIGGELYAVQADGRLNVWSATPELVRSARRPDLYGLCAYAGSLFGIGRDSLFFVREIDPDDLDGDGVPTGADAFPGEPLEWSDRDGDGVGDNGDEFPDDGTESSDLDGDGVGDNADPFDFDPTEWSDRDGDGTGDNGDEFPDDASEWADSDGDGHGNNGDWAPSDSSEWADSDGDATGDNADAFPADPLEWADYDGDGLGDNADPFPTGNPSIGLIGLAGQERVTFSRIGSVRGALPGGNLGLFVEDGGFSLCAPNAGCIFGSLRAVDAKRRRFELEVDPQWLAEVQPGLEEALEGALSRAFRRSVTLDLTARPDDARVLVKLTRNGKDGVFKAKWVFDAQLGNVPGPFQRLKMAWVWKLNASGVVLPD